MRIVQASNFKSPAFNLAGADALYVNLTDLFGVVACVAISRGDKVAVYAFADGKGGSDVVRAVAVYLADNGASHDDLRRAGIATRDYSETEAMAVFGRVVREWAANNSLDTTGRRDGDVWGMYNSSMAIDLHPVWDGGTSTLHVGYVTSDCAERVWSYGNDVGQLTLLGLTDSDGLDVAAETDYTAYNSLANIQDEFHDDEQSFLRGREPYDGGTVEAARAEMGW